MGLFSRKSETPSIDELLAMKDKDLNKIIASGKVPQKSAAELRKAAKEIKRRTSGETGIGAIAAAAKGGGTGNRNHENIPLKQRVHPAEYERILEREAKRQGLM
jgi:hypothetical protein